MPEAKLEADIEEIAELLLQTVRNQSETLKMQTQAVELLMDQVRKLQGASEPVELTLVRPD